MAAADARRDADVTLVIVIFGQTYPLHNRAPYTAEWL